MQEKQLDKGYTILNGLINASLLDLANSKVTYLNMHDLIGDMAIKIGRETRHFMVRSGLRLTRIPDNREWTEDLTKVSLMQNKISEIESNVSPMCPSLTTLLLSDNPLKYIPDMFFLHMKCLRFLIITRAPMEKLPNSISMLENLSTLIVVDCSELIYVPSLKKLLKLRELNLSLNDLIQKLQKIRLNLFFESKLERFDPFFSTFFVQWLSYFKFCILSQFFSKKVYWCIFMVKFFL